MEGVEGCGVREGREERAVEWGGRRRVENLLHRKWTHTIVNIPYQNREPVTSSDG